MKTRKLLLMMSLALISICGTAQWNDQNSSITNDLNDVYFLNTTTGWAVGRQGKIVYTANGGGTWTEQNSGTTKDLNKVYMVSSSAGYAVGDDGTFIKYNGSTWSIISISYSQDMHGVHFIDANTGWISGDWGRIMMTTNGGTSWTTQVNNSMYTNLFYDLHMISSTDGWAVGTSGRVLRYNGTNWSNQSTPATADLYSVSFSSAGNGFMTGDNSTVFYYNGSSWTTHGTSLPDNSFHVYSVCTISNSLAYAATSPGFGGGGIILKYNGSTWSTDYEYTGMGTELFSGIHFPSASKGWAVGSGGMIKTTGSAPVGISENKTSGISVYPNPFNNSFVVSVEIADAENTIISLVDVTGKIVHQIAPGNFVTGKNVIEIDGSDLVAGIYFVHVSSESTTEIIKVIKD